MRVSSPGKRTYFIRMPHPGSLNSRVSTKSNCAPDGQPREGRTYCGGRTLWSGTTSRFQCAPLHMRAHRFAKSYGCMLVEGADCDVGAASMWKQRPGQPSRRKQGAAVKECPEANLGGERGVRCVGRRGRCLGSGQRGQRAGGRGAGREPCKTGVAKSKSSRLPVAPPPLLHK